MRAVANNLHRRVSFGLFDFDGATGELRRDGMPVKLARQPARVLGLLVSRPGDVILREELRRELWGDDTFVDFERGLNFCITQVRAALGDASDNPRFIQTVPRRGYRFIAPVATANEVGAPPNAPNGIAEESGHIALASIPASVPAPAEQPALATPLATAAVPKRPSWLGWVALAGAGLAVFALWAVRPTSSSPALPVTGGAPPRIVVLPFVNLTGDATLDYLADALTDDVISQLGVLGGDQLGVIARTSAMRYRGLQKTVKEIGTELSVHYVVESSLRRVGDGLRLSSSVVPVANEAATKWWSDVFDASSTSAETQQTQAAIRVARRIATELIPNREVARDFGTTTHAAAWQAYMQAAAVMNRGTPADVRRAIAHLDEAVQRDPAFGAAWAKRAEAQHLLAMMGSAAPAEVYPPAKEAARRALAHAPNLPAAHLAHGLVQLWYDWRPAEAAASFERALALNQSLAAAHHDYAWALVALGRTDDAIRHITESRDLDPLSTRANNDVGWLYLQVRQPDAAARACQHTLAIDAGALEAQACLERAYAQRELHAAALLAARATLPSTQSVPLADSMSPREGLGAIWRWRLRELERAAATRWISPYTLATYYVLTRDHDRALAALAEAYAKRAGMMIFLARDPLMDPLRTDPRFTSILRQVSETSF
jgi:TolB-like protein/DNA-binding winged helix-turn-helix (wHTH) protein/Tfp pilus assembly protein PilF